MTFVTISNSNLHLLIEFISKMGPASNSFRYFNKRPIDIIKRHQLTVLLIDSKNNPVAYGHLDPENETVWLGICVLPEFERMGYGRKMMDYILDDAIRQKIEYISLTVDKSNFVAIHLYEKLQFRKTAEFNDYFKYELSLFK